VSGSSSPDAAQQSRSSTKLRYPTWHMMLASATPSAGPPNRMRFVVFTEALIRRRTGAGAPPASLVDQHVVLGKPISKLVVGHGHAAFRRLNLKSRSALTVQVLSS